MAAERFLPAVLSALAIASVQLFVGRMTFLGGRNDRWVAMSSGIAIAYVFLDILPHLASAQAKLLRATEGGVYGYLEHHAYLLTLLGFVVFLGAILADESAREARQEPERSLGEMPASALTGAAAFTGYSFLIGYLLYEQAELRSEAVVIFGVAMTFHFAGLAHVLHARAPGLYDRHLRYWLVAALLVGFGIGATVGLADATFALLFAFLAGAVMVVASTLELQGIRASRRYPPFVAGAVLFAGLILLLELVRASRIESGTS